MPAGNLSGKIFVTTSNYYSGRDREIEHRGLHPASWSPGTCPAPASSRLPTPICYERLQDNGRPEAPLGEREAIFVAGDDDEEAERVVSRLIEEVGPAPVDAVALAESGRQEPGSPVYNVAMVPDKARETLAGIG